MVAREIGDLWFVPYFLWILATVATAAGEYEAARRHAEESLAVARTVEGPLLLVCALDAVAALARAGGDDDAARTLLTEAEDIARGAIVPDSYRSSVLRGLGELAATRGDLLDAELRFAASLALARQVGDSWAVARTLLAQAALAQHKGRLDEAGALAREALALQLQVRDELGVAGSLERVASLAAADPERVARLAGAAAAVRERLGAAPLPWEQRAQHDLVEHARNALGDAAYDANARGGSDLSLDDLAVYAGLERGQA
jgi:tetratricopeptide (TPR) repeat protein